MDILYIIGKGCSQCNNFELRCSLRSIAQYGKNVGKVYVVGYCPDWLSDEVVKIPHDALIPITPNLSMTDKCINIFDSLIYAVDNSDISEEFLISMDDHFYCDYVDFDNYPYYNRNYSHRECKELLPAYGQDKNHTEVYTDMLRSTRAYLESKGLPIYNFALHRNMHCSRTLVQESKEMFNEIVEKHIGVEPFVLLLNKLYKDKKIQKVVVRDVKLLNGNQWYKANKSKTHVFSTDDFRKGSGLYTLVGGLYPDKCKYEI